MLFLNFNKNIKFNFKDFFKKKFTTNTNSSVNVKNEVNQNKKDKDLNYLLINPKNNNLKFYFHLHSLIYWPYKFGYNLLNVSFLKKRFAKYNKIARRLDYKSEMLLRFAKRNAQVIIHTPRVPQLVYKKHFVHREIAREWNRKKSSDMLFGFSAGQCGFKPYETKSFIANDTLVRAGLWFMMRFVKKLSPFKLRLMGHTTIFRKYLYRLIPSYKKKFKYTIHSIEDATPMPFNGCRLSHYARKRYRYHTPNFRSVSRYVKNFKVVQSKKTKY
jgi:hypothetical protein